MMKSFDYKFLIYSVVSGILALGFYYLTKLISFGYVAFWIAIGASISNLLLAFKINHFDFYNDFSLNKFFKGDYSLATSFWGVYIISYYVVIGGIVVFVLSSFGISLLIIQIIALIIGLILLIGVFNSARKYKGRKLWKILTYLLISIRAIGLIYNLTIYLNN
jgi:hypothetical protein